MADPTNAPPVKAALAHPIATIAVLGVGTFVLWLIDAIVGALTGKTLGDRARDLIARIVSRIPAPAAAPAPAAQ